MIRYSPIGLLMVIIFAIFGPHNWFMASDLSNHTQAVPSALSSSLPDASTVSDQPNRGMDIIATKQGFMVRTQSSRSHNFNLLIIAVLLLFAWPLRKMATGGKQDVSDADDDLG